MPITRLFAQSAPVEARVSDIKSPLAAIRTSRGRLWRARAVAGFGRGWWGAPTSDFACSRDLAVTGGS